MEKPFSQACVNNRDPILTRLVDCLRFSSRLLEIGSGTGQHAVYFAPELPHLSWQTSDLPHHHPGIEAWLREMPSANLLAPISLDMSTDPIPQGFDAIYSANTAHIMPWEVAKQMLIKVGTSLPAGGIFVLYGPFNYHGEFTSDSNRAFDAQLKQADPLRGIRDMDDILAVTISAGLLLIQDHDMPANNRLLVFGKST